MKENKDVFLQIRMTSQEKENFKAYCAGQGITASQMIRQLISEVMHKEDEQ